MRPWESCIVIGPNDALARTFGVEVVRDVAALCSALDARQIAPKRLILDATHPLDQHETLPESCA